MSGEILCDDDVDQSGIEECKLRFEELTEKNKVNEIEKNIKIANKLWG